MTTISTRSTQTQVLVIGGRGFIGRHVTEHLIKMGANVIVGTRQPNPKRTPFHRPQRQQIMLHRLKTYQQVAQLLVNIDVVINAVGILRQRHGETYHQVHVQAVELIAQACAATQTRFIHISALGLENPVKSRFLTSKRKGELALKNSEADWYIIRPSLVDGKGGFGAKWFRRVAKWPVHLVPQNAKGHLTPIDARDLGEAIATIALRKEIARCPEDRIYELGGDQKFDLCSYLRVLSPNKTSYPINLPAWLVRSVSHLFDLVHATPLSFGHYELLKRDNCPKHNRLYELLKRPAQKIGQAHHHSEASRNRLATN